MEKFKIIEAEPDDAPAITDLYRRVAVIEGGLARTEYEVTDDYVSGFVNRSCENGIVLIAIEPERQRVIGEIHGYSLGIKVFAHVLGELTIAVDPEFQGVGVGKALFVEFLRRVKDERPDISRVELIARESNKKVIEFYERLGFRVEGRFENRIASVGGGFEADIPMAWLRE